MEPMRGQRRLAAMRPARRLLLLAAVFVAAWSFAACDSTGSLAIPGTGPLVTVQMRGGMCPNEICDNSVVVERDGRVHSAAKPPNDLGRVPAEAMSTLTAAVGATDYAAIRSHPFTGECPVNFDGQELIFEFAAGAGTQRIASCEVDIDWGHPLFVAVGVALGEWIPMPLTSRFRPLRPPNTSVRGI
jgi:hypothetical protein